MQNDSPKRLYARSKNPGEVVRALRRSTGYFVATGVPLALGERFSLCVLLESQRAIELPAMVIGRRSVAGAAGPLRQGVMVRALHQEDDGLALLEALARGVVVDLQSHHSFAARSQTRSKVSSLRQLVLELELLLAGQAAHLPTSDPVVRGEKVRLDFWVDGHDVELSVDVIVRAVMHHAEQTACLGVLFDAKSRMRIERFLEIHRHEGLLRNF